MATDPATAAAAIREAVGATPLGALEVLREVDSTNSWLLGRPGPAPGQLDACLAFTQTAGRGRQGRAWSAPPGAGLYLSMAWTFTRRPGTLSALGLAAGVAARGALADLGIAGVQLKWPNDLVAAEGKLGGILVELRGERSGRPSVVIGIGINIALPDEISAGIVPSWGRGPVDLLGLAGHAPSLPSLAGRVLAQTGAMLAAFGEQGFAPFHDAFSAADYLRGRALVCVGPDGPLSGTGAGVDPDGALRVDTGTTVARVVSGEVSVRLAA